MKARLVQLLEMSHVYPGITNFPITRIQASLSFTKGENPSPKKTFWALWDTGSQTTFVTETVIKRLKMKPHDGFNVTTIRAETTPRPAYHLGFFISKDIVFEKISVAEFPDPHDFDILIGMDIISQGNLMVESLGGNTVLRFQVPKVEPTPKRRKA